MLTKNAMKALGIAIMACAFILSSCRKEKLTQQPLEQQKQSESSLKDMISENGANPDEITSSPTEKIMSEGYVYTESNDWGQNSIVIYKQHHDGQLSWWKTVASGGAGAGASLGSQGALVIDENHQWLYAVNAGDNTVSSFWIHSNGDLTLKHTVSSQGIMPISVTVHDNLLYVVNSGSWNICGFWVGTDGTLKKIKHSKRSLSAANAGPAQIMFRPGGKVLYVTEKNTNKIAVYLVDNNGAAGAGNFINSVGPTPFGFDIAQHKYLVVSNAAGGVPGAGSCASYATDQWGNVNNLLGAVPDFQSAPCWVATAKWGRFAYTTNAGSNSISSYYVSPFGAIFLIFFTITPTDASPIDIKVSGNNRYVYNINAVSHTITEFQRGLFGTLNNIGRISGIPDHATGLAVY